MTIKELQEIALHCAKGTVPATYANQNVDMDLEPLRLDALHTQQIQPLSVLFQSELYTHLENCFLLLVFGPGSEPQYIEPQYQPSLLVKWKSHHLVLQFWN